MSYRDNVLADNPVSYYCFDESSGSTFVDLVGGAHLTLNGTCTYGLPGALVETSTCVSFGDPVNHTRVFTGYATTNSPAFSPGSGDWAIELWLANDYPVDTFTSFQVAAWRTAAGGLLDQSRVILVGGGSPAGALGFVGETPAGITLGGGPSAADFSNFYGNFHHLVWSYDSSALTLSRYCDGVGTDQTNFHAGPSGATVELAVAGRVGGGGAACPARIDDIAFYHHTLDAAHFETGSSGWWIGHVE